MTTEHPDIDADAPEPKTARKPRRSKTGRKVSIFRLIEGAETFQGEFMEDFFGVPFERQLTAFVRDTFGGGDYRVVLKTIPGNRYDKSFPLSIADSDQLKPPVEQIIDADEADTDEEFETSGYSQPGSYDATAARAEFKNLLLEQEIKHLRERQSNGQNESSLMLQMLQASWQQSLAMQQQHIEQLRTVTNTPKEDATSQALKMMESALGMVTRARTIAEELAPPGSGGDGGGFLADGAKLIDSVGRNAGTFMPLIAPIFSSILTPQQPQPVPPGYVTPAAPANGGGELADLAARARNNGTPKEEQTA